MSPATTLVQAVTHTVKALERYFAEQDDVAVAYLFGSATRNERWRSSDIDIGIVFIAATDGPRRLERRIELALQLEKLLRVPIDIVDLDLTSPTFNHHVLFNKVVLKGRGDPARIAFEVAARRAYFDMLPYQERYLAARLERLRRGEGSDGRQGASTRTVEAARRLHKRLGGSPGD